MLSQHKVLTVFRLKIYMPHYTGTAALERPS